MRILANGVQIPDEDDSIWKMYDDKCVFHRHKLADCLHEEPPRSLDPKWREHPFNRFALCNECHQWIHSIGRGAAKSFLLQAREAMYHGE